jgi:hypothetical protein
VPTHIRRSKASSPGGRRDDLPFDGGLDDDGGLDMSDDADKATDAASVKHIGGSQSESSPHTRCANALADGIASQVALARRFNIRECCGLERREPQ